jgi:hypothetical protein
MTPSSALKARILAAAQSEPSPTRSATRKRIAWMAAVAAALDLALFFLLGGTHRGARPLVFLVITLSGSGLIALAATWAAFGRGRTMLGRPRSWLLGIALATPIALFAWTLLGNVIFSETLAATPGRIGLRCLALSLGFSIWPLALIGAARRERHPTGSAAVGAARGVALGAIAWVLVGLWCPLADPAHVAVGHFLPVLILAAFGAWLGTRLYRLRS